jgi:hypothetical protein
MVSFLMKRFGVLQLLFFLFLPIICFGASASSIPATPLMTVYRFNKAIEVPTYNPRDIGVVKKPRPIGFLAQGSAVLPCIVMEGGKPLTDEDGTPFVGFDVMIDARQANYESSRRFEPLFAQRKRLRVQNHHCLREVQEVVNVKHLYALGKEPFFDPPKRKVPHRKHRIRGSKLYPIIAAFHQSQQCGLVNASLLGRREALLKAWDDFIAKPSRKWSKSEASRAKQLDLVMRTALFEGHLDRGCNAYGACERNIVALSIRNRADHCKGQGCRFQGDFEGVATKISQYNIWDRFFTQISGLTSCLLRDDLGSEVNSETGAYYDRVQRMYQQSVADVEAILFGSRREVKKRFPKTRENDIFEMRHYYHAPAMGKCFPGHPRVEYMTGALAHKGDDFALIVNTRLHIDEKMNGGYSFRSFSYDPLPEKDVISLKNDYADFILDARKVSLKGSSRCQPYGIPSGCRHQAIGRYRRVPRWVRSGRAVALHCHLRDRGESCLQDAHFQDVTVGGLCDTQMRPVAGVK